MEDQIPPGILPEVAFVGRSNVGKSSLINALVKQKNCARVSKTPGRTQQINFFQMDNRIVLVDLPGYGYAAVSRGTRRSWDNLILQYLEGRSNLRRVFLLLDARHGIKSQDEEIMRILDAAAVSYQILLTKIDKIAEKISPKKQIAEQLEHHPAAHPEIIATSAEESIGMCRIQAEILKFIN